MRKNPSKSYFRIMPNSLRVRGSKSGLAKVSEDDVREIRRRCARGESQSSVAADYGLTQVGVSCIVRRKTWAHVD